MQQLIDDFVAIAPPAAVQLIEHSCPATGFAARVAAAATGFVAVQLLAFVQLTFFSVPRLQVFFDFLPFEFFSARQEFFFFLDLFSFVLPNHFYDFQQSFAAV